MGGQVGNLAIGENAKSESANGCMYLALSVTYLRLPIKSYFA